MGLGCLRTNASRKAHASGNLRQGLISNCPALFSKMPLNPYSPGCTRIPTGSRQSHQYILCSDDARFFNHSDTPNTESREVAGEDEVITVAKRDIQPGEELTDDYRTFEAHLVDL